MDCAQELLTHNYQHNFATRQAHNLFWKQTHGLMTQKWDLLHRIRTLHTISLRNCLVAWRLVVEHQRCHALQKHRSRQARTERFDRMFDEAREAANRRDMFGLFAIVRKLSPKENFSVPLKLSYACNILSGHLGTVHLFIHRLGWPHACLSLSRNWPGRLRGSMS